jgi:hypothetical protein
MYNTITLYEFKAFYYRLRFAQTTICMKFSKRFGSFSEWLKSQPRQNSYTHRITRLHNLYPRASLNALRGHTTSSRGLGTAIPLHKRPWASLTAREKVAREKSLDILSLARRTGASLNRLGKERNIPISTVLKNTKAFRKVKGRWRVNKRDRISRMLMINENGEEKFIEITDSRYATLIGKYHSAVREYLENGNLEALAEFKGKMVRDSDGNYYILETDPDTIRAMYERKEETPFNDTIYEGLNETM